MSESNLTTLLAVIPTLIIAIVTIIVSRKSVLDATHKQTIAPMRQKWINDLRDKIVEYVTELRSISFDVEGQSSLSDKEVDDLFVKTIPIIVEIELMLNPEEEDHNKLISLMRESCNRNEILITGIDWNKLLDLKDHTKKVLKREWEEVKKGK